MDSKQRAGEKAVEFVESGMTVGLGTGSTVFYTIRKLGEKVREGLKIRGVSTSQRTTELAKEAGIRLVSINDVTHIDVNIDGADEVDPDFNGIKGGGGALLYEKLVADLSKLVVWVVTEEKLVDTLGAFPLPIEVVPFSYRQVLRKLEKRGLRPILRMKDGRVFQTDDGNHILDLHVGRIDDPCALHRELKLMSGVVDTGLFIDMANVLVIGGEDAVEVRRRPEGAGRGCP
ncbi:MAG TPA: ribose-5-phosphate isomerase RpiA [Clostridiaceae bacterium]|nr:ribose-5-phosphate isomerase RpiA [Clostridiaceae bacterium]